MEKVNAPGIGKRYRHVTFSDRLIVIASNFVPALTAVLVVVLVLQGRPVTAFDLWMFAIAHLLGMVGIELGYHRFFAHRVFKAGPVVTYVLGVLGSMSFQGGVIWWVATHRRHHGNTDREADPHSPVFGFGGGPMRRLRGLLHAHFGWMLSPEHLKPRGWERYVPEMFKDALLFDLHVRYWQWGLVGLAIPALIGGVWYGSWHGALSGLVWGGLLRVFSCNHLMYAINSLGHSVGSRMFRNKDESRNNVLLAPVSIGLSLHNNHHAFPRSASLAFRWWQLDLAALLIWLMEKLGLVWEVHRTSRDDIEKRLLNDQH